MAEKYTHQNVPEEIAKKFPTLQNRNAASTQATPSKSVEPKKNIPVTPVVQNKMVGHSQVISVAKNTRVISPQPKVNLVLSTNAPLSISKTEVAHSVAHPQQSASHAHPQKNVPQAHLQQNASLAAKSLHKSTPSGIVFTHLNVPPEIANKFPTLKGKVPAHPQQQPPSNTSHPSNQQKK